MRIIKRGKKIKPETNESCHKCNTEFAYTQDDIQMDRDGRYIKCPVCGAFISADK